MKQTQLIFYLILFVLYSNGQEAFVLSGKVIDLNTKEPLPYATVAYPDKSIGTISDLNGNYSLPLVMVKESDSIVVSYIGYESFKTTVSLCTQEEIIKLTPLVTEIDEVVVKAQKFNLKLFLKETIAIYNKSKPDSPHIAIAHYREEAEENNRYIMYMESIGYSVYAGTMSDAAPLSNYKFFCENSKCLVTNPDWVKYTESISGHDIRVVPPSGGSNLNLFRMMELNGILSPKYVGKFSFQLDSTYYIGNNAVYSVAYKGKDEIGTIDIYADSKQIVKIDCTTGGLWSTAFHKRVGANACIRFNYFNDTPYISAISSTYEHKGLKHSINLEILVQKYFNFELNKDEYWSLNSYDNNPYILYFQGDWMNYNIPKELDYSKIANDLSSGVKNLEAQFVSYSGRWFSGKNGNETARKIIQTLKSNF